MQNMRNLLIVSAVVVMLGVAAVAQAADAKPDPKVVQKIEQGLKAYKDGKNADATKALQEAITMIQKASASGMEAFFPDAPAGWEAGKVNTIVANVGGGDTAVSYTTLERRYEKKGNDGQYISMSLLTSAEFVTGQKQMIEALAKPEMIAILNTDGNKAKAISQDGWTGLLRTDKSGEGQIVLFDGATMLNLQSRKVNVATLEKFLKTIDLKGLAAQDKTTAPAPAKKGDK